MRNVLPILIALLPITGGCYGKKNYKVVAAPKPKKGTHISGNNHIPENTNPKEDKTELTIPQKDTPPGPEPKGPPPGPVDSRESPEPIDGEVELKIGKGEHVTTGSDQNEAVGLVIEAQSADCIQIREENGENVSKTQHDELLDKIGEWENSYEALLAENEEWRNQNSELLGIILQSGDSSTAMHKKNPQKNDAEIQEIVKEQVQGIEIVLREESKKALDTAKQGLERDYREELDKLKGDIQTLQTKNMWLRKNKKRLKDRLEDWNKRFDEKLRRLVDQRENEIKEKYKEEYNKHLLTMGIEIDTLKNTLRERETKERELNCELDEKEKRIRELTSSNKEYVSKNGQLLEDCDCLSEEIDLLAINLNNAEEKLKTFVKKLKGLEEERNELKVINENLETALDELWDKYQTREHDYNNPQDGNSSEDETLDETFIFGEDKNRPKHRRRNSAPLVPLSSAVQ